ncbi:MAG: threonylcarbamoyl-AMP synthase [Desulfobulbaceae bacterium]|nr:threonylcarbamoyl-AMP synthase [Desulfobulbaceae bacterium]
MLYINPDNPQPRLIKQAADALKQGAIICYPTDTVFGIGCDIYNQKAIKRIYQLKRRPKNKPFSFMCSGLKNVSEYCFLSNMAYRLMKKSLPGAYTFVLPAMKIVPKIMMSKQKTVGIRVPDNTICQHLVEALGNPILNTSAATEDGEPFRMAYEVEDVYGSRIDIIIDDSASVSPGLSSIISLVGDEAKILREGKGDTSLFC